MADAPPNQPAQPTSTPQEDAERIRLKRLAKLQNAPSSSSSSPSTSTPTPPPSTTTPPTTSTSSQPKPKLTPQPAQVASTTKAAPAITKLPPPSQKRSLHPDVGSSPTPPQAVKKKVQPPPMLEFEKFLNQTLTNVLKVTLDKETGSSSGFEIVWLKSLAQEMMEEHPDRKAPPPLNLDMLDRLLMGRLELDPAGMCDDLDFLPVMASLPANQTPFEYLVGCWKRLNAAKSATLKKGYTPSDTETALVALDKIRELLVSYMGLALQDMGLFPTPANRETGPIEVVSPLISLSAISNPLLSTPSSSSPNPTLQPTDIPQFITDLTHRYASEPSEIHAIFAPILLKLLHHPCLFLPEGLAGSGGAEGGGGWRGVLSGLEALVGVRSVAVMMTTVMEEWIPEGCEAVEFESRSLMGPVLRLGVFMREWPQLANAYFSEPDKRGRGDVEGSWASLRGTVKTLQGQLFGIFNTLVRASPESREAVLKYFAKIIQLNVRRAGMQVDPATVSSDSFMVNVQSVLLRFAEPFIDATYSKIDRIDPLFYSACDRIDIKEETRIKATVEEAAKWDEEHKAKDGVAPPNFITNIFFLTISMAHYGYLKTIDTYLNTHKQSDDMQRQMEMYEGDDTWRQSPFSVRIQRAIDNMKNEISKIRVEQLAYETGLRDPELVFRFIGFINFLSSWVIRQVDPKRQHPTVHAELPLPTDVPMAFRVLPEYIIEDIVDFYHFIVQNSPESMELTGKQELVSFALTFLTSTWYIKNPFLKSKINEALFMGIWPSGRDRHGILGNLLNTNPLALKHLMSALMHFYIEVEQTGASSQFYDKFNARRSIAYILKVIWNNPAHREALNREAKNVDKFVKFANLMINDVTYLLDESLSEMAQIHAIQVEMDDRETWASKPQEYRREREGNLRSLERHASSYTTLGKSTVELLKVFTAETKAPFMMPEIVDRLAAMLDYNLDALAGPKCNDLVVRDPEKLKFDPKGLLKDILAVFLNLSDQKEFVHAVAGDGRSYSKELFERATRIATRKSLMPSGEIEKLMLFVETVEEAKMTMEAEEDIGEIPDEYLDSLMFSIMRDPVMLPSSKAIVDRATIKSHLLSDSKDPFNRAPLTIEEVVPQDELKAKIDAFLAERREKLKQEKEAKMDVS